jgi:hypothetical protein
MTTSTRLCNAICHLGLSGEISGAGIRHNTTRYSWRTTFSQSLMNELLRPHRDRFCLVYLDDILIYSRTREEILENIRLFFRNCESIGSMQN